MPSFLHDTVQDYVNLCRFSLGLRGQNVNGVWDCGSNDRSMNQIDQITELKKVFYVIFLSSVTRCLGGLGLLLR